jgi:hypothetical protein
MTAETRLASILTAMRRDGATVDECVSRFDASDIRGPIQALCDLQALRPSIATSPSGGQRKALFLSSLDNATSTRDWVIPIPGFARALLVALLAMGSVIGVAAGTDLDSQVADAIRDAVPKVESIFPRGQAETFDIRGTVIGVDEPGARLLIEKGNDRVSIQVQDDTRFEDEGLEALQSGWIIRVRGTVEDDSYRADLVQVIARARMEGGASEPEPDPTSSATGIDAAGTPPAGPTEASSSASESRSDGDSSEAEGAMNDEAEPEPDPPPAPASDPPDEPTPALPLEPPDNISPLPVPGVPAQPEVPDVPIQPLPPQPPFPPLPPIPRLP